jgi:Rod binding domain-containing protein
MTNAISTQANLSIDQGVSAHEYQQTARGFSENDLTAREAFQKLVAGTFYKEMLKALRSTEKELPYIGGGQAEKVFRSQMDQQLAENFAMSHGAPLVDSLYEAFARGRNLDVSA